MSLLGTEAFRIEFADSLSNATDEIVVLTAFATRPGVDWFFDKINVDKTKGSIVVRWRAADLISGASDISIYEIIRNKGWNLYIDQELHAKAFLIDKETVFVGSANITGNGLSLLPGSNSELGTFFQASECDVRVFYKIINESTKVTDDIYQKLAMFVETQINRTEPSKLTTWPSHILKILKKPPAGLWVADMFWITPDALLDEINEGGALSVDAQHDLRILGLELQANVDARKLGVSFLGSRPWDWLADQLHTAEKHELYFGDLSFRLHKTLLDDPQPYRKSVKNLLQNLYSWAEVFAMTYARVDVPGQKSQRISLR